MVDNKKNDPFDDESVDGLDLLDSGEFVLEDNQEEKLVEMVDAARAHVEGKYTPLQLAKYDMMKVVKNVLANRKLTQVAAAKLLGTSRTNISKIQNNKLDQISLEWLIAAVGQLDRNVVINVKKHGAGSESTITVKAA